MVVRPGLPDLPQSGSRAPPACVFRPQDRNQGCQVSRTHGSPRAWRMSHDRHHSPGTVAEGNPQGSSSPIFQRYFCSHPHSAGASAELRDRGHRGGAQVWQSLRSSCDPPLAPTSRSVSSFPWRCALVGLPTGTLTAVMCVGIKHTLVTHLRSDSQRQEPPPTPYHQ